ncbi:DUF7528 family protein [Halorussus caseinilyticus]|uniref:Uncharacterized protein n=1 Tax=Halorussus caseinilyticus TaxID=3034025 RepID=A0ABD5WH02_9EURY|nr:hypothetical protein [Halorussus sp. DT72]
MVEKFRAESDSCSDPERVAVTVAGETHELTRAEADQLRQSLGEALTERREFVRTAGTHREDGSYVVERRRAESSGHRKVFESFAELRRLYDRLPGEFTAADVQQTGLTGGRRHMLVHHLAEHPHFDCELAKRQPLTARKRANERERPAGGGETGD